MQRNWINIITQFIVVRNSILSGMKISRSECHYPILIRFLIIWFSYICVLQIHLRKDHTVFKSKKLLKKSFTYIYMLIRDKIKHFPSFCWQGWIWPYSERRMERRMSLTPIAHIWAPILPLAGELWATVSNAHSTAGSSGEVMGNAPRFHTPRKVGTIITIHVY